jgi:hypothetical protein
MRTYYLAGEKPETDVQRIRGATPGLDERWLASTDIGDEEYADGLGKSINRFPSATEITGILYYRALSLAHPTFDANPFP